MVKLKCVGIHNFVKKNRINLDISAGKQEIRENDRMIGLFLYVFSVFRKLLPPFIGGVSDKIHFFIPSFMLFFSQT